MSLLVFSDMDGTFVGSDKHVSAYNLSALDALLTSGGHFVPCTGRPAGVVPSELIAHPSCAYVISANGGQIHAIDHSGPHPKLGSLVEEHLLGAARAHEIVDALAGFDVTFDIMTTDCAYDMRRDYERMDQFVAAGTTLAFVRKMRRPLDCDIHEIIDTVEPVVRLSIFYHDCATLDALDAHFAQNPTMSCVSSMPNEVEISDKKATKGQALLGLCAYLAHPVEKSVAFGDSLNDASMLECAGVGVAVANATQDARTAADELSCYTNDDGAVGHWIFEHLNQ